MLDSEHRPFIAMSGGEEVCMRPRMINRHGLITGATGTGKTVSLQTMAESFSAMGTPVFMADVKGDLSGLAKPGLLKGKVGERVKELGLEKLGYENRAFPVCFWDVFGKTGHPMRTTISEMGPLLLSRLLSLNDVQSGVLNIVFRAADESGLLLLDMKDLRSMVQHVGDERERYRAEYGQISPASIGAIQRALLRLEEEGAEKFFGEPALDVMDLMRTSNGMGQINILDATNLINSPGLYACVLLWLLSEIYERMPEAGDLPKPKLVFFFDEAHLLFDDISPALLQKIEQVARLIRSKGVGVYFVSQNPSDIPDNVLGQLGNRMQHALRAFTPKDQKAVKAAAQAFRPNPAFSTEEAISGLAVGEALISFLDDAGAPEMARRCLVLPPESQIGPLSPAERGGAMAQSTLAGVYDTPVDRESAYEILTARAAAKSAAEAAAPAKGRRKKGGSEIGDILDAAVKGQGSAPRQGKKAEEEGSFLDEMLGYAAKQATRQVGNRVGRQIGNAIVRGILGGIFGGSRR